MSRRVVLSLVLALSAFALTAGLTASLPVATADLGAGSATVASCDPGGVDVSFGVDAANKTVTAVKVAGVHADCNGQMIHVNVTGDNALDVTLTPQASDGTAEYTFTPGTSFSAEDATTVNVVITG